MAVAVGFFFWGIAPVLLPYCSRIAPVLLSFCSRFAGFYSVWRGFWRISSPLWMCQTLTIRNRHDYNFGSLGR
jgi:hypothetical protein